MIDHVINIGKDFSDEPYGRYQTDGDSNGTTFREDFLLPALKKYKKIQIILDDAEGYGSSFLDEAFGGLVRLHGFTTEDLLNRFEFISNSDPSLIIEVKDYLINPKSKR